MTWERLVLLSLGGKRPTKMISRHKLAQVRFRGVLATGDGEYAPWLQQHSESIFFGTPCIQCILLIHLILLIHFLVKEFWKNSFIKCHFEFSFSTFFIYLFYLSAAFDYFWSILYAYLSYTLRGKFIIKCFTTFGNFFCRLISNLHNTDHMSTKLYNIWLIFVLVCVFFNWSIILKLRNCHRCLWTYGAARAT